MIQDRYHNQYLHKPRDLYAEMRISGRIDAGSMGGSMRDGDGGNLKAESRRCRGMASARDDPQHELAYSIHAARQFRASDLFI